MTTAAAVMATTAMAFCCSDDCQVYSPSQVNHDKQMHRWLTAHLKHSLAIPTWVGMMSTYES